MGVYYNDCDLVGIGIFHDNSTIEISCVSMSFNFGNESSTTISLTVSHTIKDKELRSLEVPEGVHYVRCTGHRLEQLLLPNSVIDITCDKTVKGLEPYIESDLILRLY